MRLLVPIPCLAQKISGSQICRARKSPIAPILNGINEDLGIGTFFGIRAKKGIIFDDMPCISNIRVWQDDIFEDLFTALVVECEDFGGFVGKIGDPFVFFGFGFGLAFERIDDVLRAFDVDAGLNRLEIELVVAHRSNDGQMRYGIVFVAQEPDDFFGRYFGAIVEESIELFEVERERHRFGSRFNRQQLGGNLRWRILRGNPSRELVLDLLRIDRQVAPVIFGRKSKFFRLFFDLSDNS